MREITVDKDALLTALRTNRANHQQAYGEAVQRYRELAVNWYRDQAVLVEQGRTPVRVMPQRLPEPENHAEDYDTAIMMYQWETGDTVTIDQNDFAQFIQDNWGWTGRFASTTASYGGQ
jgi:hypothetical protein